MKKIAIASLIALAAVAASATEIGLTTTRDGGTSRDAFGVTVGQTFGKVGVTAGFERNTVGDAQDRYSVVASYDLTKFGPVTVSAKTGAAYLNNTVGEDGFAFTAALGASVPVTKQVSFNVELGRQYGQTRVQSFDGSRITAGLKYAF
jgi:hypothetical protein